MLNFGIIWIDREALFVSLSSFDTFARDVGEFRQSSSA
jgi:hypothetical protein